jgi:hemoglobin/transferrin/lactoferrin receptor protein
MKKHFLLLLFWAVFGNYLYSQTVTVKDISTLKPIASVHIYSPEDKSKIVVTNQAGIADISELKNAEKLEFSILSHHRLKISPGQIAAEGNMIFLTEKSHSLNEVVISGNKTEEKMTDIPQRIDVIKASDIAFMNQPTSAELLQQTGNVFVQKSQAGGGSPVIRGFEANKVLIVIDGVRMNNAIYRGGHLHNVVRLDNAVMDRVEVLFGPSSVIYGSDALGGVMHFFTKKPLLAEKGKGSIVNANAFTRYATAAGEKTGHVNFNIGTERLSFLTGITFSEFGDLRQGKIRPPFYGDWGKRNFYVNRAVGADGIERDSMFVNPDVNMQVGSEYKQYDLLQKVLFKQSEKVSHLLNFQYSNTGNVPRYDRLSETSGANARFAEWYYGPEKRMFLSYTLSLKDAKAYDMANIIAAYQDIDESRHTRRFRNNVRSSRLENVKVYSVNADFQKKIKNHELRYGLEGAVNTVNSTAYSYNIVTDVRGDENTRYPNGGSDFRSAGAYVSHSYEVSPKWIITDGIRVSRVDLSSAFLNTESSFNFPFNEASQSNSAVTGSLGTVYMPGKGWRFALLGSSGFRAPNVDDLAKVFESVPGRVIVPNPDLKPEYTYNIELTTAKTFNENITAEATGWYTLYQNAITTRPYILQGQDSMMYEGRMSIITANVNAMEAYLYGFSGSIKADISEAFSLFSSVNYTYGRINTDSTAYPLDHIPPVFGRTGVQVKIKRFRGELFALYNGWKRLEDYNLIGEDNIRYAHELGTPAWNTLNVRTSYGINKHTQIQVAVENILDKNYRVFASGISAPGRNLIVTLRGNF